MDVSNLKKSLWEVIDREKGDLVALCSSLIKIPSENPPGDMGQVTGFIRDYLDNSKIEYEIVGPDPGHTSIVAKIGEGSALLFNGHCDVVPAGNRERWKFDPFGGEVTETRIRGRGASDMKCGLAGVLYVMRLVAREKLPINGRIELHVVPDEETGGQYGTKWLVDNGYAGNSIACIVAEPTSSVTCEVGQKGSVKVRLTARGRAAHGSIGNYVGENAIMKIVALLGRVEELRSMIGSYAETQYQVLRDSKAIATEKLGAPGAALNVGDVIDHVTVNVGTIKGGTKINMVADTCDVELDIRVPIGLPTQEVVERLKKIVRESGFGGIEFQISRNEANYTEETQSVVKAVVENAQSVWGYKVVPAYQWASSDARYYREIGVPTLQYGPSNTEGIHSYDEDVDIEDVVNAAKVYMGTICDLLVK
jgi:succinyl-diaminopimelate desuccinylase